MAIGGVVSLYRSSIRKDDRNVYNTLVEAATVVVARVNAEMESLEKIKAALSGVV